MVQVAAMLPALVLALPAGALADILDRRQLLVGVQVFQACVATALTALTVADRISPALLIRCKTFYHDRPRRERFPGQRASRRRLGRRPYCRGGCLPC